MKKLITLILAVAGCVGTVSAWTTVYLNDDNNSWGTSNSVTQTFNKVNDNLFYYNLPASKITSAEYRFRFYVSDAQGGGHAYPNTSGTDITSNNYSDISVGWHNQPCLTNNYFAIGVNANAVAVQIVLTYDDGWKATAKIWDSTNSSTVAFANNKDWNEVYAYSYDGQSDAIHLLGDWPGTKLTETNGIFLINVPYSNNTKIIFNDGKGSNQSGEQSSDLSFSASSIYNADDSEKTDNVSATVTAAGYATYSSYFPLDFTSVTSLSAYRATISDGNVILKKITGKVPARTGLLLVKEGGVSNVSVPTCIYTVAADENMLVATPKETTINNSAGYNYLLASQGGVVGFFYVNSSGITSDAGKAYLHSSTALNGTSTSRVSWFFEDEATAIASVERESTDAQCFDLQGRRVATPAKGLYIVNGKKVIKN